jgi:epoxyqueuosine reductase
LVELVQMNDETFRERFRKSPIKRTKRRGLLRNAVVALGNSGDRRAVPALIRALQDLEPLVREHAAWALGRLGGEEAAAALKERQPIETEPPVREALADALLNAEDLHEDPCPESVPD